MPPEPREPALGRRERDGRARRVWVDSDGSRSVMLGAPLTAKQGEGLRISVAAGGGQARPPGRGHWSTGRPKKARPVFLICVATPPAPAPGVTRWRGCRWPPRWRAESGQRLRRARARSCRLHRPRSSASNGSASSHARRRGRPQLVAGVVRRFTVGRPGGLGARRFAAGQLVLRVLMRPLDVYRGEDGSYRFEACASADPESVEATLEVSSGSWRDSGGVDRCPCSTCFSSTTRSPW
jgi:hypothetical protein